MTDPFDSFGDDDDDDFEGGEPETLPEKPPVPIRMRPWSWGALIMEMLTDPDNADDIILAHGTTPAEVRQLFETNREFQVALRECRSVITAQGPNAGFVLRSKMLAEDMLDTMYEMAKSKTATHAVKLRAIEDLVSWGRLNPKDDKSRNEATDTGVHLTMNFIGLKRNIPQIIDVEPTGGD